MAHLQIIYLLLPIDIVIFRSYVLFQFASPWRAIDGQVWKLLLPQQTVFFNSGDDDDDEWIQMDLGFSLLCVSIEWLVFAQHFKDNIFDS